MHTSYLNIPLVPTVETASAPVFISQEHAAGTSCFLHGPITFTNRFHTEGALGFSCTEKFMMSQLPQQVYNTITKYSTIRLICYNS